MLLFKSSIHILIMVWLKKRLDILSEKFSSPEAVGPVHVRAFEDITDADEQALIQRDAYERLQYLIKNLTSV